MLNSQMVNQPIPNLAVYDAQVAGREKLSRSWSTWILHRLEPGCVSREGTFSGKGRWLEGWRHYGFS